MPQLVKFIFFQKRQNEGQTKNFPVAKLGRLGLFEPALRVALFYLTNNETLSLRHWEVWNMIFKPKPFFQKRSFNTEVHKLPEPGAIYLGFIGRMKPKYFSCLFYFSSPFSGHLRSDFVVLLHIYIYILILTARNRRTRNVHKINNSKT